MVNQPVEERRRQFLAPKDLNPFPKIEVSCHNSGAAFVPV